MIGGTGETVSPIGHNRPPLSKEELEQAFRERTREQRITDNVPFDIKWQWELALSDLPASAKLIGFIVRLYAPQNGLAARPSLDAIATLTGLSRQTVMTQLKALEKAFLLTSERGKGRSPSAYTRVVPFQTMAELAVVVDIRSGQVIRPKDDASGPTIRPQSESVEVQPLDRNGRSSLIGDRSGPTIGPDLTRDLTRKEEPPREGSFGRVAAGVMAGVAALSPMSAAAHPAPVEQVMQAPAECWQNPKAQMAAGMDRYEARAQREIWITPTRSVEVTGEFKAELQRVFPLVDMASGLAASCQNASKESTALGAMGAVRRQFGYLQQDALGKQARAANYAKPTDKAPVGPNGVIRGRA